LQLTLKSLQDQTYKNWECIVVNDAGIDVSDVINKFNDPRIKALENKFKVTGIPLLLLLNRDGTLAHGTARADIQTEGPACFDKWINQFYA
jgi:glycosyltransferase involved in cell wall biosynthesis